MKPETPEGVLSAIGALQRLSELFQQRREQLAREAGLSVQQWRVLEEISGEHFMPSLFARERESSPAAVSKIIRLLLDKGVVAVAVSEADGRHREYALTPAGRRVMGRLRAARQRAIVAVWGGLDHDGLRQFTEFSSRLIRRLEEYAGNSPTASGGKHRTNTIHTPKRIG
jgi:DNA-binding MarR family transcriptional regulator